MEIIIGLLNKILYTGFFLSILYVLRVCFLFYLHTQNPVPEKFKMSTNSLFYLGLSVAFILATIFKNVGI